jgi:tellurite resistance protein TehA-like permease
MSYLHAKLEALHPASFALVMATGIVAIACKLHGLNEFALALSWINLAAYPILWGLLLARAFVFPRRVLADLASHQRAPGFFTLVAASGVLGSQGVLLHGNVLAGQVLWWVCVLLWAACTYTIFALLTIRTEKPDLAAGINGGWLVAVVATQSVAVLGCVLQGRVWGDRESCLFVLMCFWLGGGMLYLWIIGLIFYRYMFFRFSPTDLMPPYWVNMGAMAISTLAGVLLYGAAESSAALAPLRPFILGLTIMFWATATWWIPMLIVLGVWRHVARHVPLTYDPLYWGLVFPLGMYSVCTFRLSEAVGVGFLATIARAFVTAGSAAWALTFLGLAARMLYAVLLAVRQRAAARRRLQGQTLRPNRLEECFESPVHEQPLVVITRVGGLSP